MKTNSTIVIVEDNVGHFELIKKNLLRSGILNDIQHFTDGLEAMEFLLNASKGSEDILAKQGYILLLDIDMPEINGIEILEKIKTNDNLKKIPIIILTSTDDMDTIQLCHGLGCSTYIVKPTEYELFAETVQTIGHFLSVVELASI